MKQNIISNIACFHFHFNIYSRIKTKDYLLDLPKMNYILCLTTTETSEPAVNVRRTSQSYELKCIWYLDRMKDTDSTAC